jgi:DNA (cytosine-5)-methyltransferase 1
MRLLDLFCGAGGTAMGYHRAGFDELGGVDIVPQPDYPFEFWEADALGPLTEKFTPFAYFDLIHASPPCQAFTTMGNRHQNPRWPDLIGPTRDLLQTRTTKPFVIENVPGARSSLRNPIELTGEMFGLTVHRPRLFELGGWYTMAPTKPPRQADPVAVYGKPDGRRLRDRKDGTQLRAWTLEQGREAMGMPWVTDELGIREAIPPSYTEFLGRQFLEQLARSA